MKPSVPDPADYETAADFDGALWWHETTEDDDQAKAVESEAEDRP